MKSKYVLAIDAGTTGISIAILNNDVEVISRTYGEFPQYFPESNRVEQNPMEIWNKTYSLMQQAMDQVNLQASDIISIGITNQRTTSIVWDAKTGEPVFNAIVWQDTRATGYVEKYKDKWGAKNVATTGLSFSPSYSSLMIKWILDHVPNTQVKANNGELIFGNIDTWLLWKLTNGEVHATSYSNAAASGSYDIINLKWYKEWLDELEIPSSMFPQVRDDSGDFGKTNEALFGREIPITSLIADQSAAMFAQDCRDAGQIKCTHGTGSFLDVNIGDKPVISSDGINTIIGWKADGQIRYAMEGFVPVTGAAVQWLKNGALLIDSAKDTERIALSVENNGGVYFVPALTGLSAPYWDSEARGMIIGLNRGTKHAHIIRAALEGIVYSLKDFLDAISSDSNINIKDIKVDGGASNNNFIMQFQADILNAKVLRPSNVEASILGAAFMSGLAVGYWENSEACYKKMKTEEVFHPQMDKSDIEFYYNTWKKAVSRAGHWLA